MGHFYASLESGHTTASVALKRLNGYSGKNHFYRANRELGRIFKTTTMSKNSKTTSTTPSNGWWPRATRNARRSWKRRACWAIRRCYAASIKIVVR